MAPDAPRNIFVSYDEYVSIEWDSANSTETGYYVYHTNVDNAEFPDDYERIGQTDDGTLSYADVPRTPGEHTYTVTAHDDGDESRAPLPNLPSGDDPPDNAYLAGNLPLENGGPENYFVWITSGGDSDVIFSLKSDAGDIGVDFDHEPDNRWISQDRRVAGAVIGADEGGLPGFYVWGPIEKFEYSGDITIYIDGTAVAPDNVTSYIETAGQPTPERLTTTVPDDVTRRLAAGLPSYYPNSDRSSNYDILRAVGEQQRYQDDSLSYVDSASTPHNAETMIELRELGKLVDTFPRENETLEHYRSRLIAEYSITTGTGTIENLIETAANILGTQPSRIVFTEPSGGERGTASLGLPSGPVDSLGLSQEDLVDILDRLIAAGYRLTAQIIGTFTYISIGDYNANNHDPDRGYSGLDANGDPNDSGGTYAGLIV